jgi:hypothetical protein
MAWRRGWIRTHGTVTRTTVFETESPILRSARVAKCILGGCRPPQPTKSLESKWISTAVASRRCCFTETGEVVVKGRVLEASEDSLLVKFSISDTGIGMTEEQIGRLFRAFEQGTMHRQRADMAAPDLV